MLDWYLVLLPYQLTIKWSFSIIPLKTFSAWDGSFFCINKAATYFGHMKGNLVRTASTNTFFSSQKNQLKYVYISSTTIIYTEIVYPCSNSNYCLNKFRVVNLHIYMIKQRQLPAIALLKSRNVAFYGKEAFLRKCLSGLTSVWMIVAIDCR